MKSEDLPFVLVGWREKIALPEIGIHFIRCKIDTGARTSSLHAFDVETFERDGIQHVRFAVHPLRRNDDKVVLCEAEVTGFRDVTNSGGLAEHRPVIRTPIVMAGRRWEIEVNLTDRATMGYRMLLGRSAMQGTVFVDPAASYRWPKP